MYVCTYVFFLVVVKADKAIAWLLKLWEVFNNESFAKLDTNTTNLLKLGSAIDVLN